VGSAVAVGGSGVSVGVGEVGVGIAVGGMGVGVGGTGVSVGVVVGGMGVAVGGTSVAVGCGVAVTTITTGVGVAAGAPHPIKNNMTNVTPITCCNNFWWFIFRSFLRSGQFRITPA